MTAVDVLEWLEWGEKNFGSLATSRQVRRRDVLRAVERGLAQSVGDVVMCDGDGWIIEPERYREGFTLTDAGRAKLAEHRQQCK
jgi:hypothetical protein